MPKPNGKKIKREKLILASLKIDHSYQREEKSHAKRIQADFQEAICSDLLVARRASGALYLVDGQHRWLALTRLGYTEWWCRVFESSGKQEEAALFLKVNGAAMGGDHKSTVQLASSAKFRAQLVAKDPIALEVVRAAEVAGFKISTTASWPHLRCTTALYSVCRSFGGEILTRGLRLIAETWPQDPEATKDNFIYGTVTLVARHGEVDDKLFAKVVSRYPSVHIMQKAKARATNRIGIEAMVEVLGEYYNKGQRDASKRLKLYETGTEPTPPGEAA